MASIVSFANQKGGVGKTTTCVNLARYIASFGYKILLVDFDPQANASSALGVVDKNMQNTIYSAMCGENVKKCVYNTRFSLDILPSTRDLANVESQLCVANDKYFVLKGVLEGIKDEYDFIFIDCAPSINYMLVNALCASNGVVIPLQCEYFALEGLNQLLNTVMLTKKQLNKQLQLHGILLTMHSQNTRLCADVEKNMRELFAENVFESVIPRNIRLAEAPSYRMPILDYDGTCKGAKAYEQLAKEYLSKFKE